MESSPEPPEAHDTPLVVLAVLFYSLMAGGGLLWMYLRGTHVEQLAPPEPDVLLRALGLGGLAAAVGIAGARLGKRFSRSMRLLERSLRRLLHGLAPGTLVLLAVCSALGEELFFRAAMQPQLGLWATSLVFGMMHAFAPHDPAAEEQATGYPGLAWAGFAFLGGLVLGGLYLWSGSLWAPTSSHFLLNLVQLRHLSRPE